MTYETIRKFETAEFKVIVDAMPDNDLDLSWDEDGSTAEGLTSGEFIAFVARARVLHKATGAELGSDYLSGCVYRSFDDFMDHRRCGVQNREYAARGESGRCGSYFSQMISTAIEEARKTAGTLRQIGLRAA